MGISNLRYPGDVLGPYARRHLAGPKEALDESALRLRAFQLISGPRHKLPENCGASFGDVTLDYNDGVNSGVLAAVFVKEGPLSFRKYSQGLPDKLHDAKPITPEQAKGMYSHDNLVDIVN